MAGTAGREARLSNTNPVRLGRLGQFQPPVAPTGADLSIPGERREALSEYMAPLIRAAIWQNHPTSLERFLANAILAVATYKQQSSAKPEFDRRKARDLLSDAVKAVRNASEALQRIEQWAELENYLEELYCDCLTKNVVLDASADGSVAPEGKTQPRRRSLQAKLLARDRAEQDYRRYGLRAASIGLGKLEPVLEVASEKIELSPGDVQRDPVAQRFTDEMVYAWLSGTGKMPTYAKRSTRTRNPSTFAKLLEIINKNLLPADCRSKNDFRGYAQKSINRLKSSLSQS